MEGMALSALRVWVLGFLLAMPTRAQMLAFEAGGLKGTKAEGNTYSWRMEYRRPLGSGWAVGLGWLNEGHLPDHHRDGQVLQGWKYWQPGRGKLLVGVGAGLYHFYDTTSDGQGGYRDEHGNRALFTLSGLYAFGQDRRWVGMLELNRTNGAGDPQTQAVLVGLGLRIGQPFHETIEARDPDRRPPVHSVHFYAGTAIQNSFKSETDSGLQVEYRHQMAPTWELSGAYTNEGALGTFERDGFVSQIWYGDWFLNRGMKLAFGIGPFLANTWDLDPETRKVTHRALSLNARLTALMAFRLGRQTLLNVAWNRTATPDHRDTDLIVLGLGYAW